MEVYEKLFNQSYTRLRRALQIRLKAQEFCEKSDIDTKRRNSVTSEGVVSKNDFTSNDQANLNIITKYGIKAVGLDQVDEESVDTIHKRSESSFGSDSESGEAE